MRSLPKQCISFLLKAPFYALCKKGRFRPLSGECVPFAEVLVERGDAWDRAGGNDRCFWLRDIYFMEF